MFSNPLRRSVNESFPGTVWSETIFHGNVPGVI
jgi:hypothetical protein